jgi:hypothetical protein
MKVYYENILNGNASLAATNVERGYMVENLFDEMLSNNVEFMGEETEINITWPLNYFADSIIILKSNWTIGYLKVISQDITVYERPIVSHGETTIIKLSKTFMFSALKLKLNSMDTLHIGMLYVAIGVKLPLFNIGFKYKRNVLSDQKRTRYGIVYGLKRPTLRGFEVTFQDIDDDKRKLVESYIDTVQFVQPHVVEPYESELFQPLYAALTDAGQFGKENQDGFYWDSSLSYVEAT